MIDTLMIVDDNALDQRLYARIAERSGLVGRLVSFTMAEEALAFLARPARAPVDAILLDINMPRMNGFEFLDAAHERFGPGFARAAVIMLTTSMSESDQARAARYAVVRAYIAKPLERADLERVDRLVQETAA
jgi:CheY-like chemotaxis protein